MPDEYWQRFKDKPITQRATVPDQEVLDQTRCALAMIENQDWNVGRVLAKLREHGLEDNTIVLYFSDNGPNSWRWNGGMKGRKGSTDEGGVRSRLLPPLAGASCRPGTRSTQISGAIDLLPTLTSLAGIPRVGDKPLDGRDLSPLLLKQDVDWPDRMIFSAWNQNVSVRTQTPPARQRGAAVRHARRSRPDDAGQRPRTRLAARLAEAVTGLASGDVRRRQPSPAARSPKARRNARRAATPWTRGRFPSATASSRSPCSRRAMASRAAA